jgi:acyl dehydratase
MAYAFSYLYFDDLEVGQEWVSGGRTVTEADIVNFAGISGDFNAIHIDREFAATTPYRKPIAHGFGVFCIASGLTVIAPPVRTVALCSVKEWEFKLPVYAGDTIKMHSKVLEKTLKGRGRRGEVIWSRSIHNQDGKVVQSGLVITLVECRPQVKQDTAESPSAGE